METAPAPLADRVAVLEREIGRLRRRLDRLEGIPQAAAPAPTPAPSKPAPEPTPAARPTPPPLPPRHAPAPNVPVKPSAVHEVLATLQLLPPRADTGGEAQLGAWWATRIGALLAVIGVVFFGLYISAHTTPLVRWLELATIVAGISAAGAFFERRGLRIGPVVTGAGLALTYFTAFAAYAVPAVKVIDATPLAAVLQIAAVLYIGGRALRRDSRTIALMAIGFGYLSAFVSLETDLAGFAALAGLGLSLAAMLLHRHRGWMGPLFASGLLAPALQLVLAFQIWAHPAGGWDSALPYGFIALGFLVHLVPLGRALHGPDATGTDSRMRMLQAMQTALHVLAGLALTLNAHGTDAIEAWCFAAGAALSVVTVLVWRARSEDPILALFAVKASALIALGIIAHWDARTRWVALLVEAAVLLAGAHRTRRAGLFVTAVGTWAVALGFFLNDIDGLAGRLVSPAGGAVALFLLGGVALLSWADRLWRTFEPTTAVVFRRIVAIAAAVPVQVAAAVAGEEAWFIVAALVLGLALEAMRRRLASTVPVVAIVVAMLNAHVALQGFAEHAHGVTWLWIGSALLIPATAAATWILTRDGRWPGAATFGWVLVHAAWSGACLQSLPSHPALAITLVSAVAMAAVGRRLRQETIVTAAIFAVFSGSLLGFWHLLTTWQQNGADTWLIFSALALPALWWLVPGQDADNDKMRRAAWWGAAVAGSLLIWAALTNLTPRPALSLATAAVVIGLTVFARRLDRPTIRFVAGALAGLGAIAFLIRADAASTGGLGLRLLGGTAMGLATVAAPLWWRQQRDARDRGVWTMLHVILGTTVISAAALNPGGPWQTYASAWWALGGLGLFALGLGLRSRLHRVVGLAVLALCIGRIFVHDINDVQHRIIAFIALGGLLIWVGFSYQRFRHLIDDDRPDPS